METETGTADDYGAHDATYSPDDNKLRLYPAYYFSAEDLATLKAAGFKWAPKQELFVAPSWSPNREDLLIEWCGVIGDEDKSKEERSADRAERFEEYREKRRADAGGHADTFEAGPVAFGHANAGRAAKQAARHDRHRGRALDNWSKAEYWQSRTEGVIRHALHKADPKVRRGRVKRLEESVRACSEGTRWGDHYRMRLEYERAMLANEGGTAADCEMVAGGFVGRHQILRVHKSNVTGRVVSVSVWGEHPYINEGGKPKLCLRNVNIERLAEAVYRDPTPEEAEAFKVEQEKAKKERAKAAKANPKPKLINPTPEDAERLQAIWNAAARGEGAEVVAMTQKQYSMRSGGNYGPCETVEITAHGKEPRRKWEQNVDLSPVVFKMRRMSASGFRGAMRVVILTDKPQKALPWALMDAAVEDLPTQEKLKPMIVQIFDALVVYREKFGKVSEEQRELLERAEYVGLCSIASMTQAGLSDEGMEMWREHTAEEARQELEANNGGKVETLWQ